MADKRGTLDALIVPISQAFSVVGDLIAADDGADLLAQLGYKVPAGSDLAKLFSELADRAAALTQALTAVLSAYADGTNDQPSFPKKVHDLANSIVDFVKTAAGLPGRANAAFAGSADFLANGKLDELPRRLMDYLLVTYLTRHYPALLSSFDLLGLTAQTFVGEGDYNPDFYLVEVRWHRLPWLLTRPRSLFEQEYNWGTADFAADELLERLQGLLWLIGLPASAGRLQDIVDPEVPGSFELEVPLFQGAVETPAEGLAGVELGLRVRRSDAGADSDDVGLSTTPYAEGSFDLSIDIGNGWTLTADTDLAAEGLTIAVRAKSGVQVSAVVALGASLGITVRRDPLIAGSLVVFGDRLGTRVQIGEVSARLMTSVSDGESDVGIEAQLKDVVIVIAAEEDGFLKTVLPAEPLTIPFDVTGGVSARRGVYVSGGAGLEATLPVKESLAGVLSVDSVYLALRADETTGVRAAVAATTTVRLGPVTANVERFGLEALLAFPPAGNLGVADLTIGFKPPTGAGLVIDSEVVTGGGYLFFDHEKQQYAGVLQLQIGEGIGVTAFGLLTTQLPDGRPGFSLVVLITAEGFNPIALGFGFTLTGLGGLLGINRTAAVDVLRAGLRSRTLDALLFPKDPVGNAPQIVSTLNAVFPPAEGRYVFGPVAKIAWGTPTVLTINLAVILELPAPVRLIVLAQLKALLPANSDDETAIIRVNMDALGVIDFGRGELSLDATLYDSRLAQFTLTGDMALRVRWTGDPLFILAIGGFNPRFPVPAGFPRLNRLAVNLSADAAFRLRLEAYLALTSNTVQFGARVDFFLKVSALSLEGSLGFDALFRLEPFEVVADLAGGLALKSDTRTLMVVTVAMTLSGPAPWHAQGRATFEILFIKATVTFDVTFGERRLPPPVVAVDVQAMLVAALENARSWSAPLPDGACPVVTVRGVSSAAGLLVHPLGDLAVHQRIVPLGVDITRYGAAPVAGAARFDVTGVRVNGTLVADAARVPVKDVFAPAQFFDLTDQAKLTRPSFESFAAGVRVGTRAITFCSEYGAPSPPEVARRAYLRYAARARLASIEDWQAAEAELSHPSHQQIALRAYYRFVARGRVHGHALEDWLTAEAELTRPSAQQIALHAYFRHLARGPSSARAVEDWLTAQAELTGGPCIITQPVVFDTFVINAAGAPAQPIPGAYQTGGDVHAAQVAASPAVRAPLRTTGSARYRAASRFSLRVTAPKFAVASTENLTVLREAPTYTEAVEELGQLVRDNLAAHGKLQVVGKHERINL